jgi:BirA family biotin operon repressor/biotin-[acetyl-CoA-carboxylase] ligase
MASDSLAATVARLPAPWHGRYFDVIDSTQDEARAAARRGASDRFLFVADQQRAGRGRHGRTWLARPGTALLVSLLFRDRSPSPRPWRFTSLASLALVESVERLLPGLAPTIKWPNDVMLGDRKLAGVLAETSWNGSELQAIVGIGVNVTSGASDLASLPGATSLGLASGRAIDRGELLLALLNRLDSWLARPDTDLHAAWLARLWRRGQRVRLADLGGEQEVVILDAAPDGGLRVRLRDGSERRTTTGELLA